MESIPAAALTLLLELGITPEELDVATLTRERVVAWTDEQPSEVSGPACAHIDTGALYTALYQRAAADRAVAWTAMPDLSGLRAGWIDATGRRAVSAARHVRPPHSWTAAVITVESTGHGGLRLAAARDGYAYRLGSARSTSIGWVGPGSPPRTGAELRRRIEGASAGWLLDRIEIPCTVRTFRRPASAQVTVPAHSSIPIGDAALTRDALASQGVSIGLSDACLVADPATTPATMAARRSDAIDRHISHLIETITSCRYASAPCWSEYQRWLAATLARRGRVEVGR